MSDLNQCRKTLEEFIINAYDIRPSTARKIITIVEEIVALESYEYEEGVKDGRAEKGNE